MPLYKKDKLAIATYSIVGVVGLGLTILFIYLYNTYHNLTLTIITSILSFAYMIGFFIVMFVKDSTMVKRPVLFTILFPMIYISIVFLILLFLMHKAIPENPMIILDFLFWAIYTVPAFIVVIFLLILLLIGMGYAGC